MLADVIGLDRKFTHCYHKQQKEAFLASLVFKIGLNNNVKSIRFVEIN